MGNSACCQAKVAKGRTERKSNSQHTQTTSFHLQGQRQMVSLDCKMPEQEHDASVCSGSPGQQRSHACSAEGGDQDLPATPGQQKGGGQDLSAIQVLEFPSRSSCSRFHTTVIVSGSPKPYQLEEDPKDQSIVEEVSAAGTLDSSQCPEGGSSPHSTRVTTCLSQFPGSSSNEQGENSSSSESESDPDSLISDSVDGKLAALMQFLALKYLRKELATIEEMQMVVTRDYAEHFPVIFREASQCMQLVFGIDVKKVQPSGSLYVLVPVLGLTYDGMVGNDRGYPRIIFLVIVLGIIYIQGNHAREEVIWEVLSDIGVYPGREHIMYGEPRKFLTEDLVQEQYITCLEVPDSNPTQYELLWGPRAIAETNKREVLEFLGRLKATTLRAFPICEEEEDWEDED